MDMDDAVGREQGNADAIKDDDDVKWFHVTYTKEIEQHVLQYFPNDAHLEHSDAILLRPNSEYMFRVAGCNALGQGPWSSWTTTCTLPPVVTNVKFTRCNDGSVDINWDPVIVGRVADYENRKQIIYAVFLDNKHSILTKVS